MVRSGLWALLAGAALALAAPAAPAVARQVTAQLTCLQRIALPPGARLVLDLTGPGGPSGSLTQDLAGAQVPLPVTLTVPEGQGLMLRFALFVGGGRSGCCPRCRCRRARGRPIWAPCGWNPMSPWDFPAT